MNVCVAFACQSRYLEHNIEQAMLEKRPRETRVKSLRLALGEYDLRGRLDRGAQS